MSTAADGWLVSSLSFPQEVHLEASIFMISFAFRYFSMAAFSGSFGVRFFTLVSSGLVIPPWTFSNCCG